MFDPRGKCAVVALALAVCLAGCGGSARAHRASRAQELRAALLRSATETKSARTAQTSISVTVTGIGGRVAPGTFDAAGSGTVDFSSGDADLMLSVPQFDRAGGGGAIEERVVKGVGYARMPASLMGKGGLPREVQWLRLDPTRPRASVPQPLSQSLVDPAGAIAFLGAVSDDVHKIGADVVRDTRTTHDAATLTPSAASPLLPAGARPGPGPVTVDVWVDGASLARRIVVSVPLSVAGAATTRGVTPVMRIQTDFYAFGAPAPVSAPPTTQVRPFSALRLPTPA